MSEDDDFRVVLERAKAKAKERGLLGPTDDERFQAIHAKWLRRGSRRFAVHDAEQARKDLG